MVLSAEICSGISRACSAVSDDDKDLENSSESEQKETTSGDEIADEVDVEINIGDDDELISDNDDNDKLTKDLDDDCCEESDGDDSEDDSDDEESEDNEDSGDSDEELLPGAVPISLPKKSTPISIPVPPVLPVSPMSSPEMLDLEESKPEVSPKKSRGRKKKVN